MELYLSWSFITWRPRLLSTPAKNQNKLKFNNEHISFCLL